MLKVFPFGNDEFSFFFMVSQIETWQKKDMWDLVNHVCMIISYDVSIMQFTYSQIHSFSNTVFICDKPVAGLKSKTTFDHCCSGNVNALLVRVQTVSFFQLVLRVGILSTGYRLLIGIVQQDCSAVLKLHFEPLTRPESPDLGCPDFQDQILICFDSACVF